jgi:hypothetical protein
VCIPHQCLATQLQIGGEIMKRTYIVDENWIDLIGEIWQPGIGPCASKINLRTYDVENIGEPTRENVETWLTAHTDDFQSIIDFHAVVGETELPWENEESGITFLDCMYPYEE